MFSFSFFFLFLGCYFAVRFYFSLYNICDPGVSHWTYQYTIFILAERRKNNVHFCQPQISVFQVGFAGTLNTWVDERGVSALRHCSIELT